MALTATILSKDITADGEFEVIAQVTGDSSYPTGGYALTPALFGLNAFKTGYGGTGVPPTVPYLLCGDNGLASDWGPVVDFTNGNLELYVVSTQVQVAAATNVSAFSALVRVKGH